MRIFWDDFVLNLSECCGKHIAKNTLAASYIFLCDSHVILLFFSLFWHWCWLVTQGEIIWGSHMDEYNWKLCCKFCYWTKMHEFELCEEIFGSYIYMWKCSSSCCVFSFRHWIWHFIINDQEMNITGFVWWSSRLRRRFRFNSWYLKGEKNLKKDVITVQLMFACLYHIK